VHSTQCSLLFVMLRNAEAGKRGAAPIEESDVTDEQEQKLVADILKNNLSERQPVRSSPAALGQNQHHRADVSPALLPQRPTLATKTEPLQEGRAGHSLPAHASTSMPPPAAMSSGPLYKPRHVNASWVRGAGEFCGSHRQGCPA